MKILIVEDEPKTGEYLKQGLTEAGFVTDLARDGWDGLELAKEGHYDLMILDVMLPGLNGWQVLEGGDDVYKRVAGQVGHDPAAGADVPGGVAPLPRRAARRCRARCSRRSR